MLLSTRGLAPPIRTSIYEERYERTEAALALSALKPGDSVLELGTGIGFISAILCLHGARVVHTFDPSPAVERRAAETFRSNGVTPEHYRCVLGAGNGTTKFHLSDEFWASSTLRPEQHADTIEVEVRSFNEFVNKHTPNFLVCDIEGGERELLEYADLSSFDRIIMEVHPEVTGDDGALWVIDRLRSSGFVPDMRTVRDATWLFVRGNAHAGHPD